MNRGKKIACFALAGLAFLFAAFQYNDPDPWIWIALYGAAGVSLMLGGAQVHARWLAWTVAVAGLAFAAWCSPGVWQYLTNEDGQTLANAMSKEHPYIEETREFGGAMIAASMALFAAWCSPGKPPGP